VGKQTRGTVMIIGCENATCCYGKRGGTSKCRKCDEEYKEFVRNRNDQRRL